jgi:hypothetical protein
MDRGERLQLFQHSARGFFAGASWLAGVNPGMQLAVQAAAALTQLVIGQAEARWRAVLAMPIGASTVGVEAPSLRVIARYFTVMPRWPKVDVVFAPEVAAGDRAALQQIYRVLFEVLELDRPALHALFADEIERQDWRAVVDQWAAGKAALVKLAGDPAFRNGLSQLWSLITGDGPERSDAEARAALKTRWHALRDVVVGAEGPS